MTFNEFIKKHNGKKIDYDGVCDVQCVDLAKAYLDEVCGVKAGAWGNAHAYFDNFNNIKPLKDKFVRIHNTPDFVPKKGDIMVWGVSLNGNWGHIAICDGEGDTTYFYSYDQNWTGRNDPCTRVRHTYAHVLGVLRPKDQSKVNGAAKKSVTYTVKSGDTLSAIARRYKTTAAKPSNKPSSTFKPYMVKVTADVLNVRSKPTTDSRITCTVKYNEVYTIVGESSGKGATKWGKLKSGAGWISLDYTRKYRRIK